MYIRQFLFIFIIFCHLSINSVFGDSNQECSVFWGPSLTVKGRYFCQNTGGKAYHCLPPPKGRVPVALASCIVYKNSPSLADGPDPRKSPSKKVCNALRRHSSKDETYINCGIITIVNGKAQVKETYRCANQLGYFKRATGCNPIQDQNIIYDVDYKFSDPK
ncbi:uncharacterized protein MELLADRAFT_124227 [Melampsora larici-populina 98AG31]|uniref:Secreted protein n=1 Tax=Melampsora larici-populina (strain 98AG31 / pathotype 3-4-7) TaxID=747676 RepID=F4S0R9_MELLP|nr:uncharacterized protein MELLADRAFT_124227 [Melampsora larici-populina 98AG31]EGG01816.1 secreted protein [Melampsora larici-populina 98AG31]